MLRVSAISKAARIGFISCSDLIVLVARCQAARHDRKLCPRRYHVNDLRDHLAGNAIPRNLDVGYSPGVNAKLTGPRESVHGE